MQLFYSDLNWTKWKYCVHFETSCLTGLEGSSLGSLLSQRDVTCLRWPLTRCWSAVSPREGHSTHRIWKTINNEFISDLGGIQSYPLFYGTKQIAYKSSLIGIIVTKVFLLTYLRTKRKNIYSFHKYKNLNKKKNMLYELKHKICSNNSKVCIIKQDNSQTKLI